MYLNVIPIDISFDNKEGLLYYAKDSYKGQINIGSIVEIPLRQNLYFGVVCNIPEDAEMEDMKSISNLICSTPILHKYQIDLIFLLSKRYYLPLHKVLNLFLPKFILNKLENNAFQDILGFDEIVQDLSGSGRFRIFHVIEKKIEDYILDNVGEDCVVVFPDDFSIDTFLFRNDSFKAKSIIYKNSLTYPKKYRAFLDILSKKKNILIGTRKILQYNLSRYKKIYYLEDFLVRYNYNQNEKYKNLDILSLLHEVSDFEINIVSTIPSIELLHIRKKSNFEYITV